MNLDSRVKKNYKIFTPFDTDDAKEYIGSEGFFTNDITAFYDFNCNYTRIAYGRLNKINDNGIYPFFINGRDSFNFFMPVEFVDIKVLEIKFKEIKK